MKIWCVDHAGLSWNIHSELFFTKEEAQARFDKYYFEGYDCEMYQVEDIWGWCGRNFEQVIHEVLISRDDGNDATFIYGMCNEIRDAARHCGLKRWSVDGFWGSENQFILSVAWIREDRLIHHTFSLTGRDDRYNYPTIVERRSKYEKV